MAITHFSCELVGWRQRLQPAGASAEQAAALASELGLAARARSRRKPAGQGQLGPASLQLSFQLGQGQTAQAVVRLARLRQVLLSPLNSRHILLIYSRCAAASPAPPGAAALPAAAAATAAAARADPATEAASLIAVCFKVRSSSMAARLVKQLQSVSHTATDETEDADPLDIVMLGAADRDMASAASPPSENGHDVDDSASDISSLSTPSRGRFSFWRRKTPQSSAGPSSPASAASPTQPNAATAADFGADQAQQTTASSPNAKTARQRNTARAENGNVQQGSTERLKGLMVGAERERFVTRLRERDRDRERDRQIAADEALARALQEQDLQAQGQQQAAAFPRRRQIQTDAVDPENVLRQRAGRAGDTAAEDGPAAAAVPNHGGLTPKDRQLTFGVPFWFWKKYLVILLISTFLCMVKPSRGIAQLSQHLQPHFSKAAVSRLLQTLLSDKNNSTAWTVAEDAEQLQDMATWTLLRHAAWPSRLATRISPLRLLVAAIDAMLLPDSFFRQFWWLWLLGLPVVITSVASLLRSLPFIKTLVDYAIQNHRPLRASVWLAISGAFAVEAAAIFLQPIPTLGPALFFGYLGLVCGLRSAHLFHAPVTAEGSGAIIISASFAVASVAVFAVARELTVLLAVSERVSTLPVWLLGFSVFFALATISSFNELRQLVPANMLRAMGHALRAMGVLLLVYATRHIVISKQVEFMPGARLSGAIGLILVLDLWYKPLLFLRTVRPIIYQALMVIAVYFCVRWSWIMLWHSDSYSWFEYLLWRVPLSVALLAVAPGVLVPRIISYSESEAFRQSWRRIKEINWLPAVASSTLFWLTTEASQTALERMLGVELLPNILTFVFFYPLSWGCWLWATWSWAEYQSYLRNLKGLRVFDAMWSLQWGFVGSTLACHAVLEHNTLSVRRLRVVLAIMALWLSRVLMRKAFGIRPFSLIRRLVGRLWPLLQLTGQLLRRFWHFVEPMLRRGRLIAAKVLRVVPAVLTTYCAPAFILAIYRTWKRDELSLASLGYLLASWASVVLTFMLVGKLLHDERLMLLGEWLYVRLDGGATPAAYKLAKTAASFGIWAINKTAQGLRAALRVLRSALRVGTRLLFTWLQNLYTNVIVPVTNGSRTLLLAVWHNPAVALIAWLVVMGIAFGFHQGYVSVPRIKLGWLLSVMAVPQAVWRDVLVPALSFVSPVFFFAVRVLLTAWNELHSWLQEVQNEDGMPTKLFAKSSFAWAFYLLNMAVGRARIHERLPVKVALVPIFALALSVHFGGRWVMTGAFLALCWTSVSVVVWEVDFRQRQRAQAQFQEFQGGRQAGNRRGEPAIALDTLLPKESAEPERVFPADQCMICLEQFEMDEGATEEQKPYTIICGHQCFHRSCLLEWLVECRRRQEVLRCPFCRQPVDTATRWVQTVF